MVFSEAVSVVEEEVVFFEVLEEVVFFELVEVEVFFAAVEEVDVFLAVEVVVLPEEALALLEASIKEVCVTPVALATCLSCA